MDPLTLFLISQGISAAGGFADKTIAGNRIKEQEDLLRRAQGDVKKSFEDLANQQYKVSERQRQLSKTAMTPTDVTPLMASQATMLEAISQDPNLLRANLGSLNTSTMDTFANVQASDVGREVAAESNLADLEQGVLDKNIANDMGNSNLMLQRAMGSEQTAAGNIAALRGMQDSAAPNAVQNSISSMTAIAPYLLAKGGGVIHEILANGGIPAVQKLEGPEDHDKKKYAFMENGDVIDEEGNEKVAEATGGEYILNSKQAKGIHESYEMVQSKMESGQEITPDEWMIFYKAVDKVFSQPQFNEDRA